jgi:hypothetical protein
MKTARIPKVTWNLLRGYSHESPQKTCVVKRLSPVQVNNLTGNGDTSCNLRTTPISCILTLGYSVPCVYYRSFPVHIGDTSCEPRLFTWNWEDGGYNSASATSREEAKSKSLRVPGLTPDLGTLRECTQEELNQVGAGYQGMLD